ncbi:jun dimerization protein 2 isoform X4 [Loxodonta africana]
MMPGQIPDPSVTAGSLPGLGPLTGLPGSALTTEELKYADIRNIGAMIAPLHFLEVKLGKRPQPVKSELDEEEERRKRRREKNKVAAARCRNKKKERTEFLQRGNKYRPEGKEETEMQPPRPASFSFKTSAPCVTAFILTAPSFGACNGLSQLPPQLVHLHFISPEHHCQTHLPSPSFLSRAASSGESHCIDFIRLL